MIRALTFVLALLFVQQVQASASLDNSAAVPALKQCISAAMSGDTEDQSAPLMTDCVSVGSNACRNGQSDTSDAATMRCDGEEQAFWEALLTYEVSALQKSLKSDGLASLKASQKAWLPWRAARCDFVKTSEKGRKQGDTDLSFCMMETTALRAIDLMYAL